MKKYALKDIVVVVSILLLPFMFYIYKIVPENIDVWETYLFTINPIGFGNVSDFIWTICLKFLVIFLLIIWHTTCMHWWKHAILVPLTIEIMKFVSLLNPKIDAIDEIDFIYSFPITIPIIIFLIILSQKVGYYSLSVDLSNEINNEIEESFLLLNKNGLEEISFIENKFMDLKRNKANFSREEYLKELCLIRDQSIELHLDE